MLSFNFLITCLLTCLIVVKCVIDESHSGTGVSMSISSSHASAEMEVDEVSVKSDNSDMSSSIGSCSIFKRMAPISPAKQKKYSTNTLMIDKQFHEEWIDILASLESLLPPPRSDLLYGLSNLAHKVDPQIRLITGINNDNGQEVRRAILEGAKFLSNNLDPQIRTTNYYPIEYAVVTNKIEALKVMRDHMLIIDSSLKKNFLGGLLIRAVQAGHLRIIKLLISTYHASYLKNSYLLQQAIMHNAPVSVLSFLLSVFSSEPELIESYGKHQDFPLHLAIKYNNYRAFAFLFEETNFSKNIFNANLLRPINLIFRGVRTDFLIKLFSKYPNLRTKWTDEYGNNLLHLAVHQESFGFIKFLIETLKFPVDFINFEGQTALLLASILRQRQIAFLLLENGAKVLIQDRNGISPLLIAARLKDFEAFIYAADLMLSQICNMQQLQTFTQILINEFHWNFVEIMFEKFSILKLVKFEFLTVQLDQLMKNSLIFEFPKLFEFFIRTRYINPYQVIHQAAAIGKVQIVKILIDSGVSLNFVDKNGMSPIELAIFNNQKEMVRFLLSFGGLFITQNCPIGSFAFVMTNGASFLPTSSSKLNFANRNDVLFLFSKYFTDLIARQNFDLKILVEMCLQLEIFLFYHVTEKPISADVVASLNNLQILKYSLAQLTHSESTQFPLLPTLLMNFTSKNSFFIRNFINCRFPHRITASDLISYINPENNYLLSEYSTIL